MAIRANIVLTDTHTYNSKSSLKIVKTKQLIFYRKTDGNPEAIMPVLQVFLKWIMEGRLRNNLGRAGVWLVLLGGIENNVIPKFLSFKDKLGPDELKKLPLPNFWKCGSFEPAASLSGDIDFLYEIDIKEVKLTIKKVNYINEEQQSFEILKEIHHLHSEQTHSDRFI